MASTQRLGWAIGRLGRAIGHPAIWIRMLGERLYQGDDARARRHGWRVEVCHGGLSRVYRDPRFDSLTACPSCQGSGTSQRDRECGHCSGAGRISARAPGPGEPPWRPAGPG